MAFRFVFVAAVLATSPPASACMVSSTANLFHYNSVPANLAPGEVALEVSLVGAEPVRLAPYEAPSDLIASGEQHYRMKVVRVLAGEFTGGEVLMRSGPCVTLDTRPPGGKATGIVVGYLTPDEPWWTDAPALVEPGPEVEPPYLAEYRRLAATGDVVAQYRLAEQARDPKERKRLVATAFPKLRAAAAAGDTAAKAALDDGPPCCGGVPRDKLP